MRIIIILLLVAFTSRLIGQDVKSEELDFVNDYQVKMGEILVASKYLNFGLIPDGTLVSRTYRLFNNSEEHVRIFSDSILSHEFIEISFDSTLIEPKNFIEMRVVFDSNEINDYGFSEYSFQFSTDEKGEGRIKEFYLVGTQYKDYTADSLGTAAVPKIIFDVSKYDFKSINEGETASTSFQLSNIGQSKLNIYNIESNCGCISWNLDQTVIEPNEYSTLKVYFDASGLRGTQHKSITIFSNDPTAPMQMLTLKGRVPSTQ